MSTEALAQVADAPDNWRADDCAPLTEQWLADEQARAELAEWFARIERERVEAGCFI